MTTEVLEGSEIKHSQFGLGRVTKLNGDYVFAIFENDDTEKIIKYQFITEVNGAKTYFRDSSQEKTNGLPTQKDRILSLLVDAGPVGVNSNDLLPITHRFSASIYNLRQEGYDIRTAANRDGSTTFTLKRKQVNLG